MTISPSSLCFHLIFLIIVTIITALKYQNKLAAKDCDVRFGFDTFVFLFCALYCFILSPIMTNIANKSSTYIVDYYAYIVMYSICMGVVCSRIAVGTIIYLVWGRDKPPIVFINTSLFRTLANKISHIKRSLNKLTPYQFICYLAVHLIITSIISLLIASTLQLLLFALGFTRPSHSLIYVVFTVLVCVGVTMLSIRRLRDMGRPTWHLCLLLLPFALFYVIYLVLKEADESGHRAWYFIFLLLPVLPWLYTSYFVLSLFLSPSVAHIDPGD